ncbi:MAG TPA: roadblock/LC7 domain-containing protein [Gemmatimonadaceae bacterium]|nr:roadblock/LC7 domain-containing protein [Gemmatimonadaceae bacterium]
MPNIRDFTAALRQRPGVDAVLVLGRDGLLIEGFAAPGLNNEVLAARVPAMVTEAEALGKAAMHGAIATAIIENEKGYAIVAALADETLLLLLLKPSADLGGLLFDVRRYRGNIASLI